MAWPLSQDFNEAIQNASSAFTDADLKGGTVTTTPLGVPLPRSGNYADVYQITAPDGKSWAVKCFTRPVAPDLKARYDAITKHLNEANLPFTVGFDFLPEGIRVKGKTYPAVKMQWVEGQAINTFVKENLNKASLLEAMLSLWVRLCRRLRETGMAHADLQHGNVILVPADGGKLGLKLVDYDGMFVPALAGKPTGEGGHASYQHPERILTNNYSADLDRFPHLVVATALRGLLVGGKPMWDKYDTGDNLLFVAKDFTNPGQSKVMKELWNTGDPFTMGLLSHLVIACTKPLAQTPWLDTLMPEGRPPQLTPSQERQAAQLLAIPMQGAVPQPQQRPPQPAAGAGWGAPPQAPPPQPMHQRPAPGTQPMPAHEAPDLGFETGGSRTFAKKKSSSTALYGAIAAGVIAAIGIGVGIVAFGGKKDKGDGNVNNNNNPGSGAPGEPNPKTPNDPNPKTPNDPNPNGPNDTHVNTPNDAPKPGKVNWQAPLAWGAKPVYSLTGAHLLVPGTGGTILVVETDKGATTGTFREFTAPKQPLVVPQPDGVALTLDANATFVPFKIDTAKVAGKILAKGPAGTVTKFESDRSGRFVLAATGSKFEVIDLDEDKAVLTADAPTALLGGDGTSVLTLGTAGDLVLMPCGNGKPTPVTLADGVKAAELLAFCSGANQAAIRAKTGGICIVALEDGAIVKKFDETPGVCEFNGDGDRFAIATETGLDFYTTADWQPAGKMATPAGRIAKHLIFSPGGTSIVVCVPNHLHEFSVPGVDAIVKAPPGEKPMDPPMPNDPPSNDVKTGQVLWQKNVGSLSPILVTYSRDSKKIIVPMKRTGQIRVYEALTGKIVTVFKAHGPIDRVNAATLPGGRVISKSKEEEFLIWNDTTGAILDRVPIKRPTEKILKMQTDFAGRYLLFTTWKNAVLIDLQLKKEVLFLEIGGDVEAAEVAAYGGAILSADGSKMMIVTSDHNLKITPILGGTETVVKLKTPHEIVRLIDWNADRNVVLIGTAKSGLVSVDTATGEQLQTFPNHFARGALTTDGLHVISRSKDQKFLSFADVRTGAVKGMVTSSTRQFHHGVAASPDGKTVAIITNHAPDDHVDVVANPFAVTTTAVVKAPGDAAGGEQLWSRNLGTDAPHLVQYSHDGKKLIVPMQNTGRIRLYDAATGNPLTVVGGNVPVSRVVAAPLPGGRIISKGGATDYLIWNDTADIAIDRIPCSRPAERMLKMQTDTAGRYLLAVTAKQAMLIDLEKKSEILSLDVGGTAESDVASGHCGAALAADGTKMLIVAPDLTLKIIAIPSGVATPIKFEAGATDCRIHDWNAEKNVVLLGMGPAKHIVVDTATGAKLSQFTKEFARDRAVLSKDGKYVIGSRRMPNEITFYDAATGTFKGSASMAAPLYTFGMDGSADGRTVAVVTNNRGADHVAVVTSPFASKTTEVVKVPPPPQEGDVLQTMLSLSGPDVTNGTIACVAMDAACRNYAYCDEYFLYSMVVGPQAKQNFRMPLTTGSTPRSVWFLPNGNVLVEVRLAGTDAISFQVHNAANGTVERTFNLLNYDVTSKFALNGAGTHAAGVKPTGVVSLHDLTTGKSVGNGTVNAHSGTAKAPDVKTVTAIVGTPGTQVLITRADRGQKYQFESLGTYRTFPLIGAVGIEDATDDLAWAAFKHEDAANPDTVRYIIRNLGDKWSEKPITVNVTTPGPTPFFRFLAKDSNKAAIVSRTGITVMDTLTGQFIGKRLVHPANMTMIGMSPSREGFILAGPTRYSLIVPKKAPVEVAVKTPVPLNGKRKPIPDDEALKKAETGIKESLKELYAKKTPADRKKLAEALYKVGFETKTDDVSEYWLLTEARSIAAELADISLGFKIIEFLDLDFDVDGNALRLVLLERSLAAVADSAKQSALADTSADLLEDLAEVNEFDKALKAAAIGLNALTKANKQATQAGKDFEVRIVQLRKQKEAFDAVKPAMDALKAKPDDAAANAAAGKYLCFAKGNWSAGLLLLAQSNDDTLKTLAALDISDAAASTSLKKGDAWWNYAQSLPEADRGPALSRTRLWYMKSIVASEAGGLDKINAEARLSLPVNNVEYRPGLMLEVAPIGGAAALGAKKSVKIAPTFDLAATTYKNLPGTAINTKLSGVIVPPTPGRYKFVVDGRTTAKFTLFPKPDDKLLLNVTNLPAAPAKLTFAVVLAAKPTPMTFDSTLYHVGFNAYPANSYTLKWVRPGSKTEEFVPADAFFHKKSDEASLTKE